MPDKKKTYLSGNSFNVKFMMVKRHGADVGVTRGRRTDKGVAAAHIAFVAHLRKRVGWKGL